MFNFCGVIHVGDTHTITYDLRNGWFVGADIVLIDLFDFIHEHPSRSHYLETKHTR